MTRALKHAALWAGFVGVAAAGAGCRDSEQDRAAETAKEALGIRSTSEQTTGREKQDVVVIDEKKVVDARTGKVLSDKKTETPVTIEREVKEDVDVNVGKPTGDPKRP